ncbi:O-methyltransferase [Streptomyces sp. NBC_00038]|uniref:O-methyltransferase n=1 Tax=Streptomyces sp. NBC_00038 TaxID=2903615 RepID=UPI002258FE5B|nr:class I SAM-dependent methyltransferase [Streptomyces sp. NBC_00038]MCX5555116.1 class I SAM-dependent methyltransferase [Streptomyces sp. NBC_00038]
MTTLTSAPAADVLRQLFADAARTQTAFRERMSKLTPEERASWGAGGPDSRQFFLSAAKETHLAVSPETGNLLYLLARSRSARTVVEFGTSFGVSTICLAAALRDNGGGLLIGTEFEPGKAAAARRSLAEAGLDDLVDIRDGDALDTLSRGIPGPVDLVFLDGAKNLYLDVLRLLEPHLAPNALVVADNANRSPELLEHLRTSGSYLPTGFGNDVEIALKV